MNSAFSIIICTFNRCEFLKRAIVSALDSIGNTKAQYEIIIIDNNSTDGTKKMVLYYAQKYPAVFRYAFEQKKGLSFARNRGIGLSKGDILIFIDDDVLIDKTWFANVIDVVGNYDFDAIGGRVLPIIDDKVPLWVADNLDILTGPISNHNYGDSVVAYDLTKMYPFVGAHMIIKRCMFDYYGLFNTDLGFGRGTTGEDTDFFYRMYNANKKIYYCGNIKLWHPVERYRCTYFYLAKWNITFGKFIAKTRHEDLLLAQFPGAVEQPNVMIPQVYGSLKRLRQNLFNRSWRIFYWMEIFRRLGIFIQLSKKHSNTGF